MVTVAAVVVGVTVPRMITINGSRMKKFWNFFFQNSFFLCNYMYYSETHYFKGFSEVHVTSSLAAKLTKNMDYGKFKLYIFQLIEHFIVNTTI